MTDVSVRACALAVITLLVLSLPNAFAQTGAPGDSFNVNVRCVNQSNERDTLQAAVEDYGGMTVTPSDRYGSNIDPGQGFDAAFKITIPTGTAPGTYTVVFECVSTILFAPEVRHPVVVTVTAAPTSGGWGICIIATATYGSELSPEVQLLRNFRDREVLPTFAGSQFMKVFNSFYYSFSPQVARVISENDGLKAVMRYVLYPLIGILWVSQEIYGALAFNPEEAVVVAGLFAGSMIGAVYALPFTCGVCLLVRRVIGRRLTRMPVVMLAAVLIVALGFIVVSELTGFALLMQFSTSVVVLASVALPGIAFGAWAVGKLNSSP